MAMTPRGEPRVKASERLMVETLRRVEYGRFSKVSKDSLVKWF